jgi:hypothetical protein
MVKFAGRFDAIIGRTFFEDRAPHAPFHVSWAPNSTEDSWTVPKLIHMPGVSRSGRPAYDELGGALPKIFSDLRY